MHKLFTCISPLGCYFWIFWINHHYYYYYYYTMALAFKYNSGSRNGFSHCAFHIDGKVQLIWEGGDEDIETQSLKFLQPPWLVVQFFRSPPPPVGFEGYRFSELPLLAQHFFQSPPFGSAPSISSSPLVILLNFPYSQAFFLLSTFIVSSFIFIGTIPRKLWMHFLMADHSKEQVYHSW